METRLADAFRIGAIASRRSLLLDENRSSSLVRSTDRSNFVRYHVLLFRSRDRSARFESSVDDRSRFVESNKPKGPSIAVDFRKDRVLTRILDL